MSFDIFLQKFSYGNSAEANREAVLAVLKNEKYKRPNRLYHVTFTDGADVEFSAELESKGKFDGCAFFVRGMSRLLIKFIFDIAKAGDMVILPAMEGFVPILCSSEQKQHLPKELAHNEPPPVVCESGEELESLLCGGYESWRKYRDQIVSGKNQNPP